jgi:hypothetical protein
VAEIPPHAVLSEQLEERLRGRRLVAAVFTTFRFDPEFFEQEVLPVFFLDVPLSHAAVIKLVQLEDALRSVPHGVAVYYDQNGLVPEAGPARLDVKRIAVRHRTGIFHAKNVLALVEDAEPDEDGRRAKTLIVACLSANLTRAGWWENLEVCHTEEIAEGAFTRLREDLIGFLDGLERRVGEKAPDGHASLRAIRSFLRTTDQRAQRSSEGLLHAHFFDGRASVPEFFRQVAGDGLDGMCLEIISPYFDERPTSVPLDDLINEFRPREVRVFLPRAHTGEALCSREIYEWVRGLPNVTWARLPQELLRGGKSEDARQRTVHAKVYRFFKPQPRREILFIGSVNLTTPAHRPGGNLETGFLVELSPPRRPDWWLIADTSRPREYDPPSEDEGNTTTGGTKLSVRFWWNTSTAEAYWDDSSPSPDLSVTAHGVEVFRLDGLPSREWRPLPADACAELHRVLRSTSLLSVVEESRAPGLLLVQEEGMSHRPSLLFDLSPADILRYWSLLTVAQRAAFLEARAPEVALLDDGAALVSRFAPLPQEQTFFDRFAGMFLAFGNLERSVRSALREGREREATYRVFGQKYDSLGRLLSRVLTDSAEGRGDLIDHYVIALCARQLVQGLRQDHDAFWLEHASDAKRLQEQLGALASLRECLVARHPAEMPRFLDWFDAWFVRRATPVVTEAS